MGNDGDIGWKTIVFANDITMMGSGPTIGYFASLH